MLRKVLSPNYEDSILELKYGQDDDADYELVHKITDDLEQVSCVISKY